MLVCLVFFGGCSRVLISFIRSIPHYGIIRKYAAMPPVLPLSRRCE